MDGQQALGGMMVLAVIGVLFLGLVNGCSSGDPDELEKKATDGTVIDINIVWNGRELAHEVIRKNPNANP